MPSSRILHSRRNRRESSSIFRSMAWLRFFCSTSSLLVLMHMPIFFRARYWGSLVGAPMGGAELGWAELLCFDGHEPWAVSGPQLRGRSGPGESQTELSAAMLGRGALGSWWAAGGMGLLGRLSSMAEQSGAEQSRAEQS
jgi:hypothetical protein